MDPVEEVLTRGVKEIFPSKNKLADLLIRKNITLYQGFDPSMPSLHLGNFVGLMKLRAFQKLGHKVTFLVGDFTGMIGDPTDKLATRKKLTREGVLSNAKSWKKQAERILDFSGTNKAEFKFNSAWLDKVSFKDLIEITSNFTVQQLIERDMFQKRLKEEKPIHLHEFLYPIAQGYDSVAMGVDLEIGGSDQIFNMLAGRTLMKALTGKEKYVLATKLLVDNKGEKVGKTTGNALFLDSTPETFFAGIMSFPDEVIPLGYELLTEVPMDKIQDRVKKNPMKEKIKLAFEVVHLLWGKSNALEAEDHFAKTFQQKKPTFTHKISQKGSLARTIAQLGSISSTSEAKRLILNNAVDVNDKTVNNPTSAIKSGDRIKIGKKIFVQVE